MLNGLCNSSPLTLLCETCGEFNNMSARASARLTGTYLDAKSVKQGISITGARKALALLNSPLVHDVETIYESCLGNCIKYSYFRKYFYLILAVNEGEIWSPHCALGQTHGVQYRMI